MQVKAKALPQTVDSQGGRRGARLPRRGVCDHRAGRSARADRGALEGDGADPRAPLRPRSRRRPARPRGLDRRRRRVRRDLGVLRGQEALFGAVASETTAHRVIKSIDAEAAGGDPRRPGGGAGTGLGGRRPPARRSPSTSTPPCSPPHSEKEDAAGNYKGGFGFHPLLCYLDETGEPLAGLLRPGNAGSNTAADHFEVSAARARAAARGRPRPGDPRARRHRRATHAFTADCRDAGIRFSVGYEVDETGRARRSSQLPESAWRAAIDAEGREREGA